MHLIASIIMENGTQFRVIHRELGLFYAARADVREVHVILAARFNDRSSPRPTTRTNAHELARATDAIGRNT